MRIVSVAILFLAIGLVGCEPRYPELYLPVGHPADPDSAAGLSIDAPGALRPEVESAQPTATKPAAQAPSPLSPTERDRETTGHQH